jgi:hypothetical protein
MPDNSIDQSPPAVKPFGVFRLEAGESVIRSRSIGWPPARRPADSAERIRPPLNFCRVSQAAGPQEVLQDFGWFNWWQVTAAVVSPDGAVRQAYGLGHITDGQARSLPDHG